MDKTASTTALAARAWLLGIPGLLALLVWGPRPEGVPWALPVLPPLLLLSLAALAGGWAAGRGGFQLSSTRHAMLDYAIAGALLGLAFSAVDHILHLLWEPRADQPPSLVDDWSWRGLLLGLAYGGLTEEVMLRWGVLGPLAVLCWRLLDRAAPRPPGLALRLAAVTSALLFALGHLPALIALGHMLSVPALACTIGLNFIAGLVFADAFIRAGLAAAMACHAAMHIGIAGAAALALA